MAHAGKPRYKVASVRLTDAEHAQLAELARVNGITIDAWLYRRIFGKDK